MGGRTARVWIFGAITLACMTIGGAAAACPTGGDVVVPRPRPVQQVSFQAEANAMFERASQLDSSAMSRETQARMFEADADNLANRARMLRNQAQLVAFSDRESMLDIADELASRASVQRSRAMNERNQAAQLRMEARNLRDRAAQLVRLGNGGGGGGGWRRGPVRPTAESGGISL